MLSIFFWLKTANTWFFRGKSLDLLTEVAKPLRENPQYNISSHNLYTSLLKYYVIKIKLIYYKIHQFFESQIEKKMSLTSNSLYHWL